MEENKNEEVKVENNVQPVENKDNCNCGEKCNCGDNCNCGEKCNCSDKKCKKGKIAFLLIFVTILGFALGFWVSTCNNMDSDKDKPEETTTESNKTDDKKEEKKETNELTDEIKNEMMTKVANMLGEKELKKGTSFKLHIAFGSVFKEMISGKLEESYKTALILASMTPDKDHNYSGDEFTKKYKNIYGTDPNYVSLPCPAMKYDKTKNMYVDDEGGCGGASFEADWIYIDDVLKVSDTLLAVQVYIGSEYSDVDHDADYFTDYFNSEKYYDNDYKVLSTAPVTKETSITEQNKTQFTKYNINFEKASDGNYYYKNVEKAK